MTEMRITRRGLLVAGAGAAVSAAWGERGRGTVGSDGLARPSREQLAWQQAELSMFLHFGMNTFTDREWGEGTESPALFNPTALDARQWVRTARASGFRYIILTAKHHDGFCLWQTRHTEHSVRSSPWRGGRGDVVAEFSHACRAEGMKMGLYVSPWDRHEPSYGDSPAYNAHFIAQLEELMSGYGDVAEVWFDGACGEGPNGKRQVYDFPAYYRVIRRLQPRALIAICGPDIRWVGNEDGFAHETEWSPRDRQAGMHPDGPGQVWYPAECDVSIRPGWFYHAAEDARVKSLEHLMDIYYRSVGHNSVLLMNVPPDRRGLIADPDVARLGEFASEIRRVFGHDLAAGARASAGSAAPGHAASAACDGNPGTWWQPRTAEAETLTVDLGVDKRVGLAMTQELIRDGQRVSEYVIEAERDGAWSIVVRGVTVGHKKIDRFEPVSSRRFRLTLTHSLAPARISRFGLFGPSTEA